MTDTNSQDGQLTPKALATAGSALMSRLVEDFPRFQSRWLEHQADWIEDVPVPYLDIGEFAQFLIEELFDHREADEVMRALSLISELYIQGDEPTRELICIGLIEDIQTISSHRPDGHKTLIPYLSTTLLMVWNQVARMWVGHNSLMDVIRSERAGAPEGK